MDKSIAEALALILAAATMNATEDAAFMALGALVVRL
jgi:hypothetical protein